MHHACCIPARSCVFSPVLVGATDADSGVARVVFTQNGSGAAVATWTVNAVSGACDGGDVVLDSAFAATLASLASDTTFNLDAAVSDGSVVRSETRRSATVSCTNFAVRVTAPP